MKSIRTNPSVHASEGDERIRTAVCVVAANGTKAARGYVYFLQDAYNERSPIKVGYSADPLERCAQLNRKLNHPSLTVLAAFPGDPEQERALHRQWARHRLIGEWFRPAPEIVGAVELCRVLHGGVPS